MIKKAGINFRALDDAAFDDPFAIGSGAGAIFGATGGVMEAALRYAAEVIEGKKLEKLDFVEVRGVEGIKTASYKVGDVITVEQFAAGDKIDVTGTSKGHGYTGAIQRWNQHTGPMAHGSKYHRGVGSLSANSDPSRVFKNKHMAGHYGVDRVTVQNLEVVSVDVERNLLLVKGAVPGANKGLLIIRDTVK